MNKRIRIADICEECKRPLKVIKVVDMVDDGYYILKCVCVICGRGRIINRRYKRKGGE